MGHRMTLHNSRWIAAADTCGGNCTAGYVIEGGKQRCLTAAGYTPCFEWYPQNTRGRVR